MLKVLKVLVSYRTIIVVCVFMSFISIPFLQGTNTGEDFCVYTAGSQAHDKTKYVRNDNDYEPYDAQKHAADVKTYVRSGEKYFRNKANWSFMGYACILRHESIAILLFGYLISFSFLLAVLSGVRFALGNIFGSSALKISKK